MATHNLEHTPEPWQAHPSGRLYSATLGFIASTNLTGSSQYEIEANARRIVACVNSCEGISTDFLEQFGALNPVFMEGEQIRQQRDELLAALKEALGWNWLDDDAPTYLLDKYNALIDKAEQS